MQQPQVLDKSVAFDEDRADGSLVIKHEQVIPDEHISQLKANKVDSLHTRTGDFYRVATIPVSIVEQWLREGFDIHQESIQATLARLRKHDLDAFIVTNKRI